MRLRFFRHSFSLLLALAVVATPGFAQQQLKGDPSGDGRIGELNDAFIARQIARKSRPFDARADVYPVDSLTGAVGDGVVDVRDVLVFLQGLVGLLAADAQQSKLEIGQPVVVVIAPAEGAASVSSGAPLTLTATVTPDNPGDVTGITWTVDAAAAAAGFTITPGAGRTATLNVPAAGAAGVTSVTVTATPTGPAASRPRTTAGRRTVSVAAHDQGGGHDQGG